MIEEALLRGRVEPASSYLQVIHTKIQNPTVSEAPTPSERFRNTPFS
jgi:hypothetical protein